MFIDREWVVYVHTNLTNGKKYFGITSQEPELRWMKGKGYSTHLPIGRAIQKYGWDGFDHQILYSGVDEMFAKEMEKTLIAQFNTQDSNVGYNMTAGGDGVVGYHHTDEYKRNLSLRTSGENHPNYGKHLSDETREKIRQAQLGNKNPLGVVRSAETRERMSESKKKRVAAYSDDGELIKVFDSAKDAGEELGINRKNISLCCKGQRKHAGGYCWKFA